MNRIIPVMLIIVLAVFLFTAIKIDYGHPNSNISQYYIDHGVADTGALNMVTAIYLDYRAYDTLGEATVFFAAALGVFMLLRKPGEGEKD